MRVELWREWQRMFAGLQHLGPLRAMTMNRCVALEQWRPWPELQWSEEGDRAIDEDGDFDFDFRFWARAFARHRRSSTGHVFSVEFFDSEEVCFHRLCLTPQSSLETFTEWARTHQRCPGPETSAKVEPADRDPLGEGEWRSADVDSVRRMLVECEAHRLSVRAIAGTSAAVQSARFVPLHASSADGWICSIGENAALHFHPASFAHVRLHDLAPGGVECWTLRAYDESGCLVLMLMPAALSHLQLWNELVRDLD